MIVTFRIRRDTAANWTSANPVLALGEPGLETDTRRVKYGDGTAAWTALGYASVAVAWGGITGTLADQADLTAVLNAKLAKASNLSDLANVATARTNLGLGSLALKSNVNDADWSGADLSIANGGTGASSAAAARSNLGAAASGANTDITSLAASGPVSGANLTAGGGTTVATVTINMSGTNIAGGVYRIVGGGNGNPIWDWGCARGPTFWSVGYTANGTRREFLLYDANGTLYLRNLPVFASEAAAASAGFPQDAVYKTPTGELRVKL
jgi:hypothetical protein